MPVHDWTRVDAGKFHAFHLAWLGQLQTELNGGVLPEGYYALAEQHAGRAIPDVLTLNIEPIGRSHETEPSGPATTVTLTRPSVQRRLTARAERKGQRRTLAVRRVAGHRVVALIEVISAANKDRRATVTSFVNKIVSALEYGIHIVLVDLLPPGKYDPAGMHGAIWERFADEPYDLPEDQPLTTAAYAAGSRPGAFVNHFAVGDPLPQIPLFLTEKHFVPLKLKASYQAAFESLPVYWREVIEGAREAT